MFGDLALIYRTGWRFALACPFLFLIPAAIEFAQHVVEVRLGMYDSLDAMQARENAPLRMAFGQAKILALTIAPFWVIRFVGFGNDPRAARHAEPVALRRFAVVVAVSLLISLLSLHGPGLTRAAGGGEGVVQAVSVLLLLGTVPLGIYLAAWMAGAALGNRAIGPERSLALMHGRFWRNLGLYLLATLPLMVAHYAFAFGAVGQGRGTLWALMAIDSLLVGYMAVTMATTSYAMARDAAARQGVTLLPDKAGPRSAGRTVPA